MLKSVQNRLGGIHAKRISNLKREWELNDWIVQAYLEYLKFKYWHGYKASYQKPICNTVYNGYMTIEDLKLPEVDVKDVDVFWMEFPDILFPYINKKRGCKKDIELFYNEGPYELNSNVCVNEGDVVIDCGANMGLFSATVGKKAKRIYAFEPDPLIIDQYLRKTALMTPTIQILNAALDSHNGKAKFGRNIDNVGMGKLADSQDQGTFDVDLITIDEFAKQNNIQKIDFIKADIEGAERRMLTGATHVLKTMAPKLSICTYHLPDDKKILEEIVLDANPNYIIEHKYSKMYAYVK